MKKLFCIVFLLFGFLLMPITASACGNSSGSKDSCTKEMSSKSDKKECCCSKPCSKEKKNKGCDGKCGRTLCSNTTVNFGLFFISDEQTQLNVFNFATKRQKFYSSKALTSDGFSSLWLIPKIS